ncbi:hypothetical protein CFIMG_008628RA00001 [Ceratocystis fimbriata CBS 114723]|uniref:DDE-1 domain-containing protein n=1 Tax=Ceratocystis fimbriata CBS 114723 TaxID=1035309 RepID=A0A2C5XFY5_9PEZI|nr:hypothetical protein CFIMG_008628RA00001 [Ceratocystis fimbriata CBS 114723]
MANKLLADCDASPVAKCEDPTIIRYWFRLVEDTIAKYGITLVDIYNFDETGFMMGLIASGMVVTGAERRGKAKPVQPGNREWVTVIQVINAEGWAIALGWTDNETGLEWLRHFDRHTKARSSGRYRLLIFDGHESHHSVDFEKHCKDNNIITLCLPSHSSHILQPLDIGCFGPLKKAYGQETEHLIRCSIAHVSKTDFFAAFHAAHQATMTERNIKGGFRGAGLVPSDPESVISKLDVRLQIPTPLEDEASLPDPWVPKTPKTVLKAISQSEYLERRIRQHQSISPASILEALKSFSKGTKAIMHQMTLLKSENQSLR